MSYTQRPSGPRLRAPGPSDQCAVCRRLFHEPLLATEGYKPEQHPRISDEHVVMYHYGRGCSCGPHEAGVDHPATCDCYFCAFVRLERTRGEGERWLRAEAQGALVRKQGELPLEVDGARVDPDAIQVKLAEWAQRGRS